MKIRSVTVGLSVASLGIALCPYALAQTVEPDPTDELEPSRIIAHIETLDSVGLDMLIERKYDFGECDPIRPSSWDYGHAVTISNQWAGPIQKVLLEEELLAYPPWRSSGRALDLSREVFLHVFEYREQAERRRIDGEQFAIIRVMFGVVNTEDAKEMDRAFYMVRRMLPRQLMSEKGLFDNRLEVLGDAQYNMGRKVVGFCRGNIIVEIDVTRMVRRDKVLITIEPDRALQDKIIAAGQAIDELLMEKMFTEEVQHRILGAQAEAAKLAGKRSESKGVPGSEEGNE